MKRGEYEIVGKSKFFTAPKNLHWAGRQHFANLNVRKNQENLKNKM